jgi:hypothetical protein
MYVIRNAILRTVISTHKCACIVETVQLASTLMIVVKTANGLVILAVL